MSKITSWYLLAVYNIVLKNCRRDDNNILRKIKILKMCTGKILIIRSVCGSTSTAISWPRSTTTVHATIDYQRSPLCGKKCQKTAVKWTITIIIFYYVCKHNIVLFFNFLQLTRIIANEFESILIRKNNM